MTDNPKTREEALAEFVGQELTYLEQDLGLVNRLDAQWKHIAEKNGLNPARVPSTIGEDRLRERIKSGREALNWKV